MSLKKWSKQEREALYTEAIEKWGSPSQINMIGEEAQELGLATTKLQTRAGGRPEDIEKKLDDVYDELADMEIMLEQGSIIFDREKIEERKNFKLNRLRERLNNN